MEANILNPIIELHHTSKTFNHRIAVNDVSFQIEPGSVTAILGPNGAGKTTTLSMMLGLLEPSRGTVKLFGRSPKERSVRERIGVMLQHVSIMDRLKVREILELTRSYYPNPMDMEFLIHLTGLTTGDLNRYTEKLSGGQKRSLGFAMALAGDPEVLFFDEPTVGLDTMARRRFWETVHKLAKQGKTILFTTHYLQEADDTANRIILFNQGSIVADGTPGEIKSRIIHSSLSFLSDQDGPELRSKLSLLPPVTNCYDRDGRIYVSADNTDAALAAIFAAKLPVRDIKIHSGSLDEVFEQLTTTQEETAI
ncbi:ABC transporter ATP-binding protein [Paenibacillus sp. 79R4]|nr:ABC transporter ATP-binding protein [Paenibacillus sp. 79R4]